MLWVGAGGSGDVGDLHYVEKVVRAGRRAIGPAHPGASLVRQRLAENQKVLRVCVRQRRSGRRRFAGYVLSYPLKDEVAARIEDGGIRREAEFGTEPLAGSFEEARFLYVAMVLGTGRNRPHLQDKLRAELLEMLASGRVRKVYARPGSKGAAG